jgi:ankyrin repeat protein
MNTKEFFDAVERGDQAVAASMLNSDSALALAVDDDGATALHHAAFHGHREIVELLQNAGGDINARDRIHGATPAGWAIHYLRERGALLAIEIDDLHFAIERGDTTWVERMLARHPWLARHLP